MLDSEEIAQSIAVQLSNPLGKVLVLSGPWGSGKTHLWREKLAPHLKNPLTISLFGLNSVDALRGSIATESIKQQLLTKTSSDFVDYTKVVAALGKAAAGRALDVLTKTNALTQHLNPLTLVATDHVICLDDVERLSGRVDLKDVLGVANYLAEARSARVLLILNDDKLDQHTADSKRTMELYRERVVSTQYRLKANIDGLFDFIVRSCGDGANVFDVTTLRAALLRVANRSGTENLRSVRRTILRASQFAQAAPTGVLTQKHYEALSALQFEQDNGSLQDEDFYRFDPILFSIPNEAPDDASREQRRSFVSRYFDTEDSFSFSRCAYHLVRHGFVTAEVLSEEFAGKPGPSTPTSKTIEKIKTWKFRFYSSSELLSFSNEIATAIDWNEQRTAFDLLFLWNYHCYSRSLLELDPDEERGAKVTAELERLGRDGDRTIAEHEQLYFSDFRKFCERQLLAYRVARDYGQQTAIISALKGALSTADSGEAIRILNEWDAFYVLFTTEGALAAIFDMWTSSRELQANLLQHIEVRLRQTGVPESEHWRHRFFEELSRIHEHEQFGAADRSRFRAMLDRTKQWQRATWPQTG